MVTKPGVLTTLLGACLATAAIAGSTRTDDMPDTLRPGNYLSDRGPYDPRPYDDAHLRGRLFLDASFFRNKNRRWLETGLVFGGYVSINGQAGSANGTPHAMSETVLLGTWEPVRKANAAGRVVLGVAHDHTIGSQTTRTFADRQGIVETPDDLDTDPDRTFTTLGILLWEHEFQTGPERGWAYRAGQLFAPAYFGLTYFLDDDRRLFLARPLAAAAGAQWVGNNDIGLGANAVVWSGRYYASAAIMDGKANRKYPQLDSLLDGQLLYLAEVGIESDRDGPGETAIRITASHLDLEGTGPESGAGQSVMISAERRFDGRFALFGRWSKSFERLSGDYRALVSLGSAWLRPFGFTHDVVAFGVFRGRPSDPDRADESGAELCYNLQLTQDLTLMPDIQYWSRHDAGGTRTSSWIGGLRVNFEF